jgi:hypothetical protein
VPRSVSLDVLVALCPVVPLHVFPVDAPRVVRHCARCGADRPFASSDAFRVNANKRRLDVWLVRRCGACDATWNQPVHERITLSALGERLARYQDDDPDTIHAVAFDEVALRRHGRVEPATFRVERPLATPPFAVRVCLARPFAVRFDRVLCDALGLSRTRLRALVEAEEIVVAGALDRPVAEGTVAWIGGSRAADAAA